MAVVGQGDDRSLTQDTAARGRVHRQQVVDVRSLGQAETERWLALRAANPALDSPYFHPGFAQAVASTRDGVRVAIGHDAGGQIVSFLPVQLDGRTCHPAGFPAADFQGPICDRQVDIDVVATIRACGGSSYRFDHLREGVTGFEPWIQARQQSPFIDVDGGLEGYLSRASRSGKDKISEARRLSKRAEKDHGEVRFVATSRDHELLDSVIELKRRQYAATGARDYFSDAGHVALLHHLLDERDSEFGGMLSAVYAGPQLLAAHFGLRAGPVLHWWFPVYNPEYPRLSPGWILLRAAIDAAAGLGIRRIDLGRGIDDYKRRAMTGQQFVLQGAAVPSPFRRRALDVRRRAVAAVKSSPAAPALRGAVHRARRASR
jgi:CelD/BcsL family acetyltransferase involved in cellulose biosynthesis